MSKWIPDRKVWAGGLFGILAFASTLLLNTYAGADIPLEAAGFIALGIAKIFEYIIPPTMLDVIKRIDNDIVAIAGSSPESEVTKSVGAAAARAVAFHDLGATRPTSKD